MLKIKTRDFLFTYHHKKRKIPKVTEINTQQSPKKYQCSQFPRCESAPCPALPNCFIFPAEGIDDMAAFCMAALSDFPKHESLLQTG